MSAVAPDLNFNTAVTFVTNTNWQNYGVESTMSYLVQMVALIGIAGMNRLVRFNELAMSGRAVEAGLVRMLELIEAEVISCLVLLGVKRYSELTARHLEPITPLPGRLGLASAFPLLSEGY